MKLRIGILVGTKGRGSNMANIIEACKAGRLEAEVAVVVAPSPDAPALALAEELKIRSTVVTYDEQFGQNLLKELTGCDLLCLAGFLRLIPPDVLSAFPDRILNIHPALLPKFGGKGMYGSHVHQAVLAAGETQSGATVHLVNQNYDEGQILVQTKCAVESDDTVETLAERVLQCEHQAYVRAIKSFETPSKPTGEPAKPSPVELQHPLFTAVCLPLARLLAWTLFTLLGPFVVKNRRNVPRGGGVIVLSNHLADVDPIAVQMACPRPIYFMSKSELFSWPILGRILRAFRAFPVSRGAPDRTSLRRAAETAKAGQVVCIFPEGELSESGELIPLKAGSGLIVRMAGVPVICCGLKNTNRIMPYGKFIPRPALRLVSANWGEARSFDKKAAPEEIMAWAEAELLRLTDRPPRSN
ncbi:MAG: formyltransferase family protein [Fimbriimonadaceae bacterium]